MKLAEKKCVPCEGNIPKMNREEITAHLNEIDGWQLKKGHLFKKFTFKNFMHAIGFVNEMSVLAENEGHHPDFAVHYDQVEVEIWTHALKGLSENDFILAAKIDKILT